MQDYQAEDIAILAECFPLAYAAGLLYYYQAARPGTGAV
jgi:hypothetical protein